MYLLQPPERRHLARHLRALERALLVFIGDFLHFDGHKAVTPTHGHVLDADSRFQRVVRAAIAGAIYAITRVLERHGHVHVVFEFGNHDLASTAWLIECMALHYQNEPRVTIDRGPGHYHYWHWESVLIGTHHGHGRAAKPNQLPLIMAADRPQEWGGSRHRQCIIGHGHHRLGEEHPGCMVDMIGILPPGDAHAHNEGYRSKRSMLAISYDAEQGERYRYTATPAMIDAGYRL